MERPLMILDGQPTYPTMLLKIAGMLDSIQRSDLFVDGNKRIRLLLIILVLRGNGVSDDQVTDDQWYELIVEVADQHWEVSELATRLQELMGTHR